MPKKKRRTISSDLFGGFERDSINSRDKGIKNELEACKWLKEWTGVPFSRVPSSGGLRWKNVSNAVGDVICQDENFHFPFTVETKHYAKIGVPKVPKLRSNSIFYKFWEQALLDNIRLGKKNLWPMMLIRENGMPKGTYYFVVDDRISKHLESDYLWYGESIKIYDSQEILRSDKFVYLYKKLGL